MEQTFNGTIKISISIQYFIFRLLVLGGPEVLGRWLQIDKTFDKTSCWLFIQTEFGKCFDPGRSHGNGSKHACGCGYRHIVVCDDNIFNPNPNHMFQLLRWLPWVPGMIQLPNSTWINSRRHVLSIFKA